MSDFEPVSDLAPSSDAQPQLPSDVQQTQAYYGDLQKAQRRRNELLDEKARLEAEILEAQLRLRQNNDKESRQTSTSRPRFEIPAYSVEAQKMGVFPSLDWEQRRDHIEWFMPKLQFEKMSFRRDGLGWKYSFEAVSSHLFRVPVAFTINDDNQIVELKADLSDIESLCSNFCDYAKVVYIPKMQINALLWGINSVAVATIAKVDVFSSLTQLEEFVDSRVFDTKSNNNRVIFAATKSRSSMQFARQDSLYRLVLHWQVVLIDRATADCGAKITAAVHEVSSGKEVGNVQNLFDLLQQQGVSILQTVKMMIEQLLK